MLVKCDYCDATAESQNTVPRGWLMCRLQKKEKDGSDSMLELVKGPTACPSHRYQLYLASYPSGKEVTNNALTKSKYMENALKEWDETFK